MATNVNMTGTVKVNTVLNVRNRPSYGSDVIGSVSNGTKLTITQFEGEWYYASNIDGWINSSYVVDVVNNESRTVNQDKNEQQQLVTAADQNNRNSKIAQQYSESQEYTTSYTESEVIDSLIVSNLNGIYGIPYQFMKSVDARIGDSDIGRKYSEKILSKMPLLCLTPGKVDFLSNYSKSEKAGALASIISGSGNVDDIITSTGRYYTFSFDYRSYFNYVNGLCWTGAKFLGIEDVYLTVGNTHGPTKKIDWQYALNSKLKSSFSQSYIGFYMDSTDSVSETFSNNTTQSQLASTLNGFSDTAKELNFLLGAGAGQQFDLMNEDKLAETMATIDSISKQYLRGNTLFKTIANNFATIAVGGKLLFPEIWADSEFSRDFDITIKLRTPDCDTMSWYLNIYVPLCHLIAFAAGHQTETPNGYYSPFLVRAFYKGLFNVDMGIITNMSIRKGKEAAWNIDGLPTEIDVDITIKDLYHMLSLVDSREPKKFVTNNLLMDYIANTCGVNINQLDIERSIDIYNILMGNKITKTPINLFRKFQDALDTFNMKLYDKTLNKFLI